MPVKEGERVGAILGSSDGVVEFLGYGVYEGRFPPVEAVGMIAEMSRDIPDYTNPRIRLDSGKVVYGCECWWGPETRIKATLVDAESRKEKIVEVDIDDVRAKFKESEDGAVS